MNKSYNRFFVKEKIQQIYQQEPTETLIDNEKEEENLSQIFTKNNK